MRSFLFGMSVLFVAASVSSGMIRADEPGKTQQAETEKQPSIHDLLVERRDTLQEVCAMKIALNKKGKETFESLFRSELDLAEANLQLADTHAQRMEILKERVDLYRKIEGLYKVRFDDARVTRVEVLIAKSDRLNAEIDLLREEKSK